MVSSGADIQPDKNWAKVHNSILELLASTSFTARELRCLLFLLRMTYGEREKDHAISLSEWEKGTNLKRGHVNKTLQELARRNVITKTETGPRSKPVWAFNKYFEQWIASTPVGTTFNGTPVGTTPSTDVGTSNGTPVGTKGSTPVQCTTTAYLEREIQKVPEAPPPAVELTQEARKYGAFVTMLEQVFAITISPGYADFIAEWVNAVNEREWVYALGECKARKGGQFLPKYVASILRRVVAERTTIEPADVPVVVNVTKLEADAWPI